METQRRSILQALNSKYIYGKVPLLHTLVFLFQMAAVSLLVQKFNSAYSRKPLLTTMITNAILGGIADTTAQTLTSIRQRARTANNFDKIDGVNIEIHELDRKSTSPAGLLGTDTRYLPPPFDFERLTRFMSFGFLMATVQYRWFAFLSSVFPLGKTGGTASAFKRVAFDQCIMAPIGLSIFFIFMTVAEGGGKRALTKKFQEVYVPALKANYVLWPAVQIVNFRFIPLQLQIPFVSTIGIAWTAYLSLSNAAEEE